MTQRFGDNWEATWKSMQVELESADLANFRRNTSLSKRLQSPQGNKVGWESYCNSIGVLPEWKKDTRIGNPSAIDGEGASADSVKGAYILGRSLSLLPTRPARVLEVGPGFGVVAEKLCRFGNIETYYFVDDPVMHKLQNYYMQEAGFIDKCVFGVSEPDCKVDLIISTFSLSEMSLSEIQKYFRLFDRISTTPGAMYLIQYTKSGHNRVGWEKFPFSPQWEIKTKLLEGVKTKRFTEIVGITKK